MNGTHRCIAGFLLLFFAGCEASKEAQAPAERRSFAEELRSYEETFRPSDYDPDQGTAMQKASPGGSDSTRQDMTVASASPEMIQGFRVQLYSSTSIDEAEAKKKEAEDLFPAEWFYLEFDSPTYKVRAGNFQNRFEADRLAKQLADKGFPNSWTVPERVFKKPSPPVHEEPPQQHEP